MVTTIHAEAGACPDDEALLALVEGGLRGAALERVDEHLDGCTLCREVVAVLGAGSRETPAAARALTSGPRPRARLAEPATQIGRFVVREPIGEGAMGVVWAAYDPELDRRVAIKLLHAHRDDTRGRARLALEARAMAKLSHPNVVTVYDVGVHVLVGCDDAVYVAMELVEGTTLRAWLDLEPRSRDAVLEVFRQAGAGLAAAHAAGLVHRDFKPENVFVDRSGAAKVGDFGLARNATDAEVRSRSTHDESSELVALTRTGALLGTPAYMAPEQLDGEPATAAADQFAFCVALWEALTGARPFAAEASVEALRTAIARGPAAPPASIPARLVPVLLRGLAPRAEQRFADLRALLGALEGAVRPAPRFRALRIAAAGAAALLVAGALVATYALRTPEPCGSVEQLLSELWPSTAQAQLRGVAPGALRTLERFAQRWARGRVEACVATHVRHEQSEARLDERMSCLDRARTAFDAVSDALRADTQFAGAEIVAALPDPAVCSALDGRVAPPPTARRAEVASLRTAIDRARIVLAAARSAQASAASFVARADAIGYAPLVAEARLLRAASHAARAEYDDAIEDARVALFAAESASDDRGAAEAWLALIRAAGSAGRYTEAAQSARHAEAAITRAGRPIEMRQALDHLRGVVRTNLGALDDAERDLREAMLLATMRFGADSAELASIDTALGNLARLDGDFVAALAAHQRALALDRAAWGERHPRVARDLHNVAGILRHLERRDEALVHYREALSIERASIGEDHPDFGLTSNSLGLLAFEAGDDVEAGVRWESARRIFEASGHEDLALVRYNLALLALRQERYDDAASHARAAIAIDERRLGEGAKRVGGEQLALGRAELGAGRDEAARVAFARAQTIARTLGDLPLDADATRELRTLDESARAAAPRVALRTALLAPPTVTAPTVTPAIVTPPTVTPAIVTWPTVTPTVIAPPAVTPPPTTPRVLPPLTEQQRTGSGGYAPGQAWE